MTSLRRTAAILAVTALAAGSVPACAPVEEPLYGSASAGYWQSSGAGTYYPSYYRSYPRPIYGDPPGWNRWDRPHHDRDDWDDRDNWDDDRDRGDAWERRHDGRRANMNRRDLPDGCLSRTRDGRPVYVSCFRARDDGR